MGLIAAEPGLPAYRTDPKVLLMKSFFAPIPPPQPVKDEEREEDAMDVDDEPSFSSSSKPHQLLPDLDVPYFGELVRYDSDLEQSGEESDEGGDSDQDESEDEQIGVASPTPNSRVVESTAPSGPRRHLLPVAPPLKRRKLGVPVRKAAEVKRGKVRDVLKEALKDIDKHIVSKQTGFAAGPNGLQAHTRSGNSEFSGDGDQEWEVMAGCIGNSGREYGLCSEVGWKECEELDKGMGGKKRVAAIGEGPTREGLFDFG